MRLDLVLNSSSHPFFRYFAYKLVLSLVNRVNSALVDMCKVVNVCWVLERRTCGLFTAVRGVLYSCCLDTIYVSLNALRILVS